MTEAQLTSQDELIVWLLHHIADEFADHAILKGGMVLRLLDCPRATNDLDYVFVPYRSKKDIRARLTKVLQKLPSNAEVEIELHSKMLRARIVVNEYRAQIEASVAESCASKPMTTAALTNELGYLSRIIRIVDHDVALANKLAAWNERRLVRDLYDCFFFFTVLGAKPDPTTLEQRLRNVQSRLPRFRKRKSMTREQLLSELEETSRTLNSSTIEAQLGPLMEQNHLVGLVDRIKTGLANLVQSMRYDRPQSP